MARYGAQLLASAVYDVRATPDPWVSLISLDGQGPDLAATVAPRTLRIWTTRGLQGFNGKGIRFRLTTGVGDISTVRQYGDTGVDFLVPPQGLALPIPAGNVRVDVSWPPGALLLPDPEALIYGTISHGAPVLTWLPGLLGAADPGGVGTSVTLDPEEYPFASQLRVTSLGTGNTIGFGTLGAEPLPDNGQLDFPFVAVVILSNSGGSSVYYSIGVIS